MLTPVVAAPDTDNAVVVAPVTAIAVVQAPIVMPVVRVPPRLIPVVKVPVDVLIAVVALPVISICVVAASVKANPAELSPRPRIRFNSLVLSAASAPFNEYKLLITLFMFSFFNPDYIKNIIFKIHVILLAIFLCTNLPNAPLLASTISSCVP